MENLKRLAKRNKPCPQYRENTYTHVKNNHHFSTISLNSNFMTFSKSERLTST